MRMRITLGEADLKEACALYAEKHGMKIVGDISVSHTPAGGDRPWDPSSTSVSFEIEKWLIGADQPEKG